MSQICKINRAATFDAIMQRDKEDIAYQLMGILMLLYNDHPGKASLYTAGWNASRKAIRDIQNTDHWVKQEDKP